MVKSPFKFLDSYTSEDRPIFFGREVEITEVYRRIFESKILLVYGISGTGKSSLINCGLTSRFDDSDWLPLNVRRGSNIIDSLNEAFNKQAITPLKKSLSVAEKLQSIYLDHFKPVYFIFDQFEEIVTLDPTDQAGKAAITVDGREVELTAEDVQVTLKAKPGWMAAQGSQVVVVLSTEITEELKAEGMARDVVHLIQTARKDEQLDYQDRIKVHIDASGPVAAAILAYCDYIKHETLAVDLGIDKSVHDPPHGGQIDDLPIRFAIEVVR